ncbi:MAG: flagellar biosynthetic protein FliO [Hyphomicrobiales bacterium]|nr:flagellar biosynthetic protein FliO [Hyphomicrobiales bacterium]
MEAGSFFQSLFALIFVLALIGVIAMLLRKYAGRFAMGIGRPQEGKRALYIVESLPLDTRHRLAMVRWGTQEYLLVLGQDDAQLIDRRVCEEQSHVDA